MTAWCGVSRIDKEGKTATSGADRLGRSCTAINQSFKGYLRMVAAAEALDGMMAKMHGVGAPTNVLLHERQRSNGLCKKETKAACARTRNKTWMAT